MQTSYFSISETDYITYVINDNKFDRGESKALMALEAIVRGHGSVVIAICKTARVCFDSTKKLEDDIDNNHRVARKWQA